MDKSKVKRSSGDLLSDLPLSIIHIILAFVPIRDAVKTSILSRQWRYIWASLPHLAFNDTCVSDASDETRLNRFITQALLLHEGPIQKFKLHVSSSSLKSCFVDHWLVVLSRHGIRVLTLIGKRSEDWFHIHSSLYSCHNLTQLELFNCEIPPPPPTFNGFSCLRSLALERIKVACIAIESLVANSPLLETLTLNNYSGSLELRIRAPNLKRFYIKGVCIEIFLYAPLLSKLLVVFYNKGFTAERLQQKTSVCNYINFLGSSPNLEELSGAINFVKYLSIGVESCHRSLVFHHLRFIDISVSYNDIKEILVVVRLIRGAPNLHKLKISSRFEFQPASEVDSTSLWEAECAPDFTYERLKVIEMGNVRGKLHEMKLIKFLLQISPVLEMMSVSMVTSSLRRLTEEEKQNVRAELLGFSWGSPNAKFLFKCIP